MSWGPGVDAAAIFGQKRPLRRHVQAREEGQPLIEDVAHDVAVAGGAEELQGQQRAHGVGRRHHGRARKARSLQQRLEGDGGQVRHEEEQPAELGAEMSRAQIELAHVGDVGRLGAHGRGAFLIPAPRQPREAFLLQNAGDAGRTAFLAEVAQRVADVVDGEVLFAQHDDLPAHRIGLLREARPRAWGEEELPLGVLAEGVAEHPKAAGGVAEAPSHLCRAQALDEVGPQRLVLAVGGAARLQERSSLGR
jgi:hypothetical protein